jgi:hypothetical protein
VQEHGPFAFILSMQAISDAYVDPMIAVFLGVVLGSEVLTLKKA